MVRQFILAASMTILLTSLLAGCDSVIVERYPGPSGDEAIADLDQATRRGAIVTTIIGNPFQGNKSAFDAEVLRRMRGQNRGNPTAFVAVPDRRTDPSYTIVVVFNPADAVNTDVLCRNRGTITGRPYAGSLTMAIAFCQGEKAISGAAGHVTDLKGSGESKFATLVATVTRVMVPPKVPKLPRYRYYDGQYTHDDDNEHD